MPVLAELDGYIRAGGICVDLTTCWLDGAQDERRTKQPDKKNDSVYALFAMSGTVFRLFLPTPQFGEQRILHSRVQECRLSMKDNIVQ
jgi:hypothetical protein